MTRRVRTEAARKRWSEKQKRAEADKELEAAARHQQALQQRDALHQQQISQLQTQHQQQLVQQQQAYSNYIVQLQAQVQIMQAARIVPGVRGRK